MCVVVVFLRFFMRFFALCDIMFAEEQRNKTFETLSTSQKGESVLWYNFGSSWTHPYYHKSSGQSDLENGLLSVTHTWNKVGKTNPNHNTF